MGCVETAVANLIAEVNVVVDCYTTRGCALSPVATEHGCVADVIQAIEETIEAITECEEYNGGYVFHAEDFSGCLDAVVDAVGEMNLGCRTPCNGCAPPIPDTLYVTFANLEGDFAPWNGKHTLTWYTGCEWYDDPTYALIPGPYIRLYWAGGNNRWRIWLVKRNEGDNPLDCLILWQSDSTGNTCAPSDDYSVTTCWPVGCTDTDSCANIANATCVVSLT
jgi:hypothetical protein